MGPGRERRIPEATEGIMVSVFRPSEGWTLSHPICRTVIAQFFAGVLTNNRRSHRIMTTRGGPTRPARSTSMAAPRPEVGGRSRRQPPAGLLFVILTDDQRGPKAREETRGHGAARHKPRRVERPPRGWEGMAGRVASFQTEA